MWWANFCNALMFYGFYAVISVGAVVRMFWHLKLGVLAMIVAAIMIRSDHLWIVLSGFVLAMIVVLGSFVNGMNQ